MSTKALADDYFELWKTTDDAQRHELAQKVFADSAVHYAAPANVSFTGVEQIEANIARVNKENIQQAGLRFDTGDVIENHNSVQVQWSVAAPNGQTVATGRDFLLLGEDGRVTALYMFNGQ